MQGFLGIVGGGYPIFAVQAAAWERIAGKPQSKQSVNHEGHQGHEETDGIIVVQYVRVQSVAPS